MLNLRPFQIVVLAIFGILAVIGIMLLSGFTPKGGQDKNTYGERVLIWGSLDAVFFNRAFNEIENSNKAFSVVNYVQIDERTFNESLVNAIAEDRGPDMILLPSSEFVRQRNRLIALSYDTVPLRGFKDANVDGAEIFARADGVYAIPFAVDPIVMYWNRDIFASNGLAQAPTTWEYIVNTVVPSLTSRDNNRNILRSAVAFGEFNNVKNAKEMLLVLSMQSGSQLIEETKGRYEIQLNSSLVKNNLPPLEVSVQFFTNFSNSNSQLYSWNRSQPLDRNAFVAGDLAIYFGYASELDNIQVQNPNLNFDMAPMPQGASATVRRTYGEFYGLAIPKSSRNVSGAFIVANIITQPSVSNSITESLGIAPAQRSAIAAGSGDSFRQVVLSSALIARGWLDPDSSATDAIFQDMIEDVTSGRESLSASIGDAIQKIRLAF